MSIENTLERIAAALERQAANGEKLLAVMHPTAPEVAAPAKVTTDTVTVVAETKKAGRPRKTAATETVKPVATTPAVVPAGTNEEFDDGPEPVVEQEDDTDAPVATSSNLDDFLDEAPPVAVKDVTIEEVRAALKAYSDRNDKPVGSGREKAQKLLKDQSKCETLTALKALGDQKTYKKVLDAAQA